jgi:hypothetical protein
MSIRINSDQSEYRGVLDQLTTQAATETGLEKLLESINKGVTPPLRMRAATPVSRQVFIDSITVTNPEHGRRTTIQPISGLIPTFAGGSITLPASSGGSITASGLTLAAAYTLTVTSGNFIKILISINSSGQVILTFGVEGASESAATLPVGPSNTLSVGYIVAQNSGGTIQNVAETNVYQFVGGGGGGGGGGGSGTGNPLLETMKNTLIDSTYDLVTPNIFSVNEDDLVDGSSTGAFDAVTATFKFSSASQTYVSKQMLDPDEFLGQNKDVNKALLHAFWDESGIDTAATYAVSRDGGTNWKTVTMSRVGSSETYTGEYTWTSEDTAVSLASAGAAGATLDMNQTTRARIAGFFTLTSSTINGAAVQGRFKLSKTGTPTGYLYASIVKVSGGQPSTDPADVLAASGPLDISTLTGSPTVYNFSMGPAILDVSTTYALVLRAEYLTYTAATHEVLVSKDTTGTAIKLYNSGTATWSDGAAGTPELSIYGRGLDLRVRITSSAGSKYLAGVGLFYDPSYTVPATGVKKIDVKHFTSTDNLNSFTINFLPDPDLLNVYYVQAGQVFRFGAFSLDGYTVRFPVNSFNNGGVTAPITLVFEQSLGGSFDNSDLNRNLLAANYLGSLDAGNDLSSNGRGIKIRNAAGQLREISLDSSDNIIISSLP